MPMGGDQQAADASLMSNMDTSIFVGALDGGGSIGINDVGPAMHAQHQHIMRTSMKPHRSASPGVLSSYSGNADDVSSVGSRSSQQQQQQQQQQARAPSSMTMSALLGTQAQAQASYGIGVDASSMNNFGGGGSGGGGGNANMAQLQNANGGMSSMFHGAANLQNGNTCIDRMMPPPSTNLPMSMTGASCDINNRNVNNISGMMTGGGEGEFDGLNDPGRLTPPSHPSAQQHGRDSASLLGLASSSFTTLQQRNNTFQQQQQQQSLMGGSLGLTTPSPLEMGSVTSLPSMPQNNVLRSLSVGSVQSTTSTGSACSSGVVGNSRTGRVAGRGGFPGPGRALGLKRLRVRSDGSTGSAGSNSLGLSVNSAATKSNIQALLRLHASVGGKQPNAEGMYPIHIACRDYPTIARLIGTLLCTSPGVGRLIVGRGSSSASLLNSAESLDATASAMAGSYPIHIALAHSASLDVVGLLVRQNPELLIKGDGNNRVPLSIAFSRRASPDVLDLLLGMNPNAAALPDLRNNYPLHLACARGTGGSGERFNLSLLKRLVEAYPAAVHERNFNGKTPLDLAQAGGLADDDAISYLQEMAYHESDDAVIEAPDA